MGKSKSCRQAHEVYSELAPLLNDLYCFYVYIGDWKARAPQDVLTLKRNIDRIFYVNYALFSLEFQTAYRSYIDLCFIPGPYGEFDASAELKTDIEVRKQIYERSKLPLYPGWENYFAPHDDVTSREQIRNAYQRLMKTFVAELGLMAKNWSDPSFVGFNHWLGPRRL